MSAEETATAVLTVLRSESDDLLPVPVDPIALARRFGINVYGVPMDNNVSGLLSKATPTSDTDMFLNTNHSAVRQRFTAAHELGHYFQNLANAKNTTYFFKRDDLSSCGTDTNEIFANQFAANLLMPADVVRNMVAGGQNMISMAAQLHVSGDAMKNRLKNLGLLSAVGA